MSTEQENFDDLLKSKLDKNEFLFNEANWDKAEKLIIEAEKKRKRRIIGFIFFIGMILGICVMVPFVNLKNNTQKKNFIGEKKKINTNYKTEVKKDNKIEVGERTGNPNCINADIIKDNEQANTQLTNGRTKNKNEITSSKKVQASIEESKLLKKRKSGTTNLIFAGVTNTKKTKNQTQNSREGVNKTISSLTVMEEKNTIEPVKTNSVAKDDKVNKEVEMKNSTTFKNKAPDTINQTSTIKKDTAISIISLQRDTAIITKDSLAKTKIDSVKPITNDATQVFKRSTFFSLDIGANYIFGWTNGPTSEAAGFNAIFGISVTHQFTKQLAFLVGMQYNSLAHLSYSSYTSSNLQYDLGYNQTKTVITPTILYYVTIPIKIQYYFNEKNSFSIGINTLYLLNTSSKVEAYTESTFGNPAYSISTKKGYMDGFSSWDLQPALAYHRSIIKCLSVNAEIYYGLMDLKNNAVFGISKSEHNSGFKLTLSYNLVHK